MDIRKFIAASVVVICFLFVVIGITTIILQPKKLAVTNVVTVNEAFTSTAPYFDKSIIAISAQNGIVSYNLETGASKQLAPAAGIESPDQIQVSGNKQYVLFHTNFIRPNTALANNLITSGKSIASDYWWVYSLTTSTYTALPAGTLQADFSGDKVLALLANPTGESLVTYDSSVKQIDSISVNHITDFYPTNTGYFLLNTNNELLFSDGGVVSRKVAAATAIIGGSAGKLYITQKNDKTQNIASLQLDNYKTKVIATNVSGKQALWNNTLVYGALVGATSELRSYTTTTGESVVWKVKAQSQEFTDLSPLTLYNNDTALVYDGYNNYLLVSARALSPKASDLLSRPTE